MWANRSFLREVENPTAALAAKYWAVREAVRPTTPRKTSRPPIFRMYPVSPFSMPTSMICLTTRGMNSSKVASSILNRGAKMLSFRYAFKYFSNSLMASSSAFFSHKEYSTKFSIISQLPCHFFFPVILSSYIEEYPPARRKETPCSILSFSAGRSPKNSSVTR